MTGDDRWTVAAPEALCWEQGEDESVLFDRRSGQTHLLTAVATECLQQLQNADLDLDQLTKILTVRFQAEPEQVTREQTNQMLMTLRELGLITAVRDESQQSL